MYTYKISLLGRDIGYTQSPRIHSAIAKALGVAIDFDVCDVTFDKLEAAVKDLLSGSYGFFVTRPYKTEVAKIIHSGVNSVNVVRCEDRMAYNSDGIGLVHALDRNFPDWNKNVNGVLVLGAGGAASSVAEMLTVMGKDVYVLNRTAMRAARLCSATGARLYVNQPCELIVNCTSVGANGEDILKNLCVLPSFDYAFDLIYSPEVTPFMRRCGDAGAKTANGFDMLIYQAIEGDKFLFMSDSDTERVFEQVKQILG